MINPFSLGFPSVDTGNPLILNISHRGGMSARSETFTYDALDRLRSAVTDLTGKAGARTLSMTYSLKSARDRRLAGSGPRIRVTVRNSVTTQRVGIHAEVGIGEEQSTALAGEAPQRTARGYTGHEHLERTGLIHMNLHALSSAGLDIAQAVIGLAGLIPVAGNVADGLNAGISVARGRNSVTTQRVGITRTRFSMGPRPCRVPGRPPGPLWWGFGGEERFQEFGKR